MRRHLRRDTDGHRDEERALSIAARFCKAEAKGDDTVLQNNGVGIDRRMLLHMHGYRGSLIDDRSAAFEAVRARNELEFPEIDEPTKILRLLNVLLGLNFQGMNARACAMPFTPLPPARNAGAPLTAISLLPVGNSSLSTVSSGDDSPARAAAKRRKTDHGTGDRGGLSGARTSGHTSGRAGRGKGNGGKGNGGKGNGGKSVGSFGTCNALQFAQALPCM
ncbi:hypothetical protein N0V86_007896 [Didymella sp. IMI 355093]|nr:hypothetical protein N0V86_007896 [Didymella sp. IMI 355093]